MHIKEIRFMAMSRLRELCIRNKWYTHGTNEEYDILLHKVYDDNYEYINLTTEKLAEIAVDIMEHSDLPVDYDVCCVMFELARAASVCFEVE